MLYFLDSLRERELLLPRPEGFVCPREGSGGGLCWLEHRAALASLSSCSPADARKGGADVLADVRLLNSSQRTPKSKEN